MWTLSRLEREWRKARYRHLLRDGLSGRPEAGADLDRRIAGKVSAAAVVLMRLNEAGQAAGRFPDELRRLIHASQGVDGCFRDASDGPHDADWSPAGCRAVLTALCARVLAELPTARTAPSNPHPDLQVGLGMTTPVDRPAADTPCERACRALAAAQRRGGGWGEPHDEAGVTGVVLFQLARVPAFRSGVDLASALSALPRDGDVLASHARTRLGRLPVPTPEPTFPLLVKVA